MYTYIKFLYRVNMCAPTSATRGYHHLQIGFAMDTNLPLLDVMSLI